MHSFTTNFVTNKEISFYVLANCKMSTDVYTDVYLHVCLILPTTYYYYRIITLFSQMIVDVSVGKFARWLLKLVIGHEARSCVSLGGIARGKR